MPGLDPELLNDLPVGVAIAHDAAATLITTNRFLADLLQVESSANISQHERGRQLSTFGVFRGNRRLTADELPLTQAARTNTPVLGWEADIVRSDGTRVALLAHATPMRDSQGASCGAIGIFLDVSQQKGAQLAGSEAEMRLRHVIESMSDAFCAVDHQWRCTYINEHFARMAGVRPEEAIGKSIWTVFPESTRVRVHDEAHRAVIDGQPRTIQEYCAPLNISLETRLYPTPDGLASFTTDVTARKRFEEQREALIERERAGREAAEQATRDHAELLDAALRLAAIVESSDDPIISKDVHGTIRSWNRAAERMFGFTAQEAIGGSIHMIVPPDLRDDEEAVLGRIRRGSSVDHYETVRMRKDGTRVDVSLSVSPLRTPSGAVLGASTILRDITARKREDAHAERAKMRAAFLAQMAATLSVSLDDAEIVKRVADLAVPHLADWCAVDIVREQNELERVGIAHVDNAHVTGLNDTRLQHLDTSSPFSVPQVIRRRSAVLLPRVSNDMLVTAAGDDPDLIALARGIAVSSYLCVPMLAHGRTIGALTLVMSSPDHAFTEDDLGFAQDVASRAALAVDNARAYSRLDAANRLKDEFLATLSHELRTPLNAILGYARMLRSGMIAREKQTRAIEVLERNATSLTLIVNDVLDLSRIVSGKIRLSVQPVDLSVVINDAIATVLPAATAKGVQVETVIDPGAKPVAGDPSRLQQVIWNLVANAVKFTPRGGRVDVRVEPVESSVDIVVSDNGIGIRPEFLPFVFERFRQGDAGSTREHGGLGLGLAISRHIVEMHGGTIQAASEGEGRGTTVCVRLPVMIVRLDTPFEDRRLDASRQHVVAGAGSPDLGGVRVLAVDDDRDGLKMVQQILEFAGADVVTADSGVRALEKLSFERADVLITDLGMPAMDGFALIEQVRQSPDEQVRSIPAAALTAYARSEDRARVLRSGFHMHLGKPIDPNELVAAVAALARRVPKGTNRRRPPASN